MTILLRLSRDRSPAFEAAGILSSIPGRKADRTRNVARAAGQRTIAGLRTIQLRGRFRRPPRLPQASRPPDL